MPLLLVENAHLAFGHWPLLDGAALVLEPGERVGLIGRNGAGKSSLLKAIAGVQKLDEGTIRFVDNAKMPFVPVAATFPIDCLPSSQYSISCPRSSQIP